MERRPSTAFSIYLEGMELRPELLPSAFHEEPTWPRVPDVTREELVEIVRRAQEPGPDQEFYVLLFQVNTPHPQASGLIFWPPKELEDAAPEEIVEAALSYRPISLGPAGA
ncbi:hypothetical protein ACFQ07_12815 [Actinomadura adrarensis]|uniref:Uncharacterized protein n=1 Tax=Actinomadura adrarensis TaxID=1819600 RepID=A0ABW3CHP1_9ACTN